MKNIIFYLILFTITSCNQIPDDIDIKAAEGIITGKVNSANGTTAIGAAHIFAFDDTNKTIFSTYSDSEGNFSLSAPEGKRTIYIQTGTGANFRTDFSTTIIANQTSTVPEATTRLKQVAKLGFMEGVFDNTDELLTNMGYNITQINDYKTMNFYDIVYLKVGFDIKFYGPQIFPVLSTFVSNGGNIYASNWAATYLVGGDLYPTDCNMPGGFIPDDKLCVKWQYNTTEPTPFSQVLNERLKKAVGFSDLNLVIAKGSDSYINSHDALYWETLIKDNDRSYLLKTKNFSDTNAATVNVGNAANDGWKTICVKATNGNSLTVRVPQNIAAIQIGNGAQAGSCSGNPKSGTVYYSVFNSDGQNPAATNLEKNMKIIKSCILDF